MASYHVHYLLPHFFCLRIIMLVLGPYASTYLIWWLLLLTFRCFTITQNKENIYWYSTTAKEDLRKRFGIRIYDIFWQSTLKLR